MTSKGKILNPRISYPDRAQLENNDFAPLDVVITDPLSTILLLSSKDFKLLIKSLHQLDKFGQKDAQNMAQLYHGQVMESILKNDLFHHVELFVKRFSLKIASEMFFYEELKYDNHILQEVFDTAKHYYKKSDDLFITEYSAVILLNLMREGRFVVDLEQDSEFIAKLFKYISDTADPDILFNSYKVAIRLFQSLLSTGFICETVKFPFERVIGDLSNEFPDIQKAALEILAQVVQCKGEAYTSKLCCPVFFEELMKILENDEVVYIHALSIDVLKEIMEVEMVANEFADGDYILRLIQHIKRDNNCRFIACSILATLAKYQELLEFLNISKVPEILLDLLLFDPQMVTKDILIGLRRMLYDPEALSKVINKNPVNALLKILKSETLQLKIRDTAAELLGVLSARSKWMCEEITTEISAIVWPILSKPFATYPTDYLLNLLIIMNNLAKYHVFKTSVLTDKFAQSLVFAIANSYRSSVLFSNLLNTASNYISEDKLRNEFSKNHVAEIILRGLKNSAVIVKNAATNFILLTGKFPNFSSEYIDNGVLK
ncbi:ARMC3.2 family protein [Megaselia abdita]